MSFSGLRQDDKVNDSTPSLQQRCNFTSRLILLK
jgi:hypothetical protein